MASRLLLVLLFTYLLPREPWRDRALYNSAFFATTLIAALDNPSPALAAARGVVLQTMKEELR